MLYPNLQLERINHYGELLTDDECEVLLLDKFGIGARVFRKHLSKEAELFQTKWYPYRVLHPVVATYRYAHELNKTYQRYYQMTRDYTKGKYIRVSKGKDIWYAKNPGGFIKGRQQADMMGIPYEFYTSAAYEFLYIKKWKHIPRQCHLYAVDVIEYVEAKWQEYARSALILSEDPFFKNPLFVDRPEFVEHQRWIENRLALSKVKNLARQSLVERGFQMNTTNESK